ncbi:MAG TPA: hypothetical protein V6D43_12515 [Candidatus Sericytochromatia bacterium]
MYSKPPSALLLDKAQAREAMPPVDVLTSVATAISGTPSIP